MAERLSTQMTEGYRRYPIDDHGKLRYQYASLVASAANGGALAANDTIPLFRLPPGRKRILPHLSRISTSAYGAGRTLDIGHKAYLKGPASTEADDVDAFVDGMDVSAQVNAAVLGTSLKFDMYSLTEVDIYATILGGTLPLDGTLQVLLAYLYE